MRHSPKLRFAALLVLAATAAATLAATASAKPLLRERFHNEGTVVFEDFCGVPGLTVEVAFVVDGRVLAVPRGPDRFAYFLEHLTETEVLTNRANGKTVTAVGHAVQKDLRVTDNGDGTLTILAMGTGNLVLYGQNGEVLARNPGQTRVEILVDHGGTPTDPFDDVFLSSRVVKGSTGRSDDFCAATVAAWS
jgi:hypothetical protein